MAIFRVSTRYGLYIVIIVMAVATVALLWMIIPHMPGSFLLLSLPTAALRILHSLAFSLAVFHGIAVSQKIFFWYHFILLLMPISCIAGLCFRKNIARKALLSIASLNGLYWTALAVRAFAGAYQSGAIRNLPWQLCGEYLPAVAICVLYVIYLNDRALKALFLRSDDNSQKN